MFGDVNWFLALVICLLSEKPKHADLERGVFCFIEVDILQ